MTETSRLIEEGLSPSEGKRQQRPALHALTGIRFVAALWVMLFHFGAGFSARLHMPAALTTLLTHGYLGVFVFFVLSGFILLYSYQGNLQSGRDAYRFFVARIARLYPVYILALVIQASVLGHVPVGKEWMILSLLQSWTPATSDFGLTWIMEAWSLSVEFFFYCCLPVLMVFFERPHSRRTLYLVVGAAIALILALQSPSLHPGIAGQIFLPLSCLPEFVLGLGLCALFFEKKSRMPASRSADRLTALLLILPIIILATNADPRVLSLAAASAISFAIYRFADGTGPLTQFLGSKAMMLLGGASYTLYLIQGPIRILTARLFSPLHPGLDNLVFPFVLIAISCTVFLFYEEPMRRAVRGVLDRAMEGRRHPPAI